MINKKDPIYRRKMAELVNSVLEKKNWTQEQLATKLNTSKYTISRWLNEHSSPSAGDIKALNDLLSGPDDLPSNVYLPILSALPNGGTPTENRIGEISVPIWVLGGSWKDCYVVKVKKEDLIDADFAIIKQNSKPSKQSKWVVLKIDGESSFAESGSKPESVVGTVVMTIKY